MDNQIKITKKKTKKGDDGYHVISVRIKDETISKINEIAKNTNRSRNDVINILLSQSVDLIVVENE